MHTKLTLITKTAYYQSVRKATLRRLNRGLFNSPSSVRKVSF